MIKTRVNERAGLPDQDPLTQVYSHAQLSEVVAAARRGGKGVLCHSYSERGCHDAVTAGVRSLEHGVFVGERTLHEMRRRGTWFTPTLTAIAGLAESPDPVLAERGRTYLPVLKKAVLAAHELGVPLAAGTDSSGGTVDPVGREVELMHAAGLSPLDALRTATTGAARLMGLQGTAGRPTRGHAGDLLLVPGDPLADLSVLSSPTRVVRSASPSDPPHRPTRPTPPARPTSPTRPTRPPVPPRPTPSPRPTRPPRPSRRTPMTPPPLSRRGVLAGAASLGGAALASSSAPAAAEARRPAGPSSSATCGRPAPPSRWT